MTDATHRLLHNQRSERRFVSVNHAVMRMSEQASGPLLYSESAHRNSKRQSIKEHVTQIEMSMTDDGLQC